MATSLDPISPVPPMTTIFMVSPLFCARSPFERSVHQEIHGRLGLVARYEALAEVAREVVVRGVGLRPDDGADRVREAGLHLEPWKHCQDTLHLIGRDPVVLKPAPVEGDAGGAEGDLRLLVEGDGRRGI